VLLNYLSALINYIKKYMQRSDRVVGDPNEKIELGEFVELFTVDWTWSDEKKKEAIMHEL